jgi:hypothetical protein
MISWSFLAFLTRHIDYRGVLNLSTPLCRLVPQVKGIKMI